MAGINNTLPGYMPLPSSNPLASTSGTPNLNLNASGLGPQTVPNPTPANVGGYVSYNNPTQPLANATSSQFGPPKTTSGLLPPPGSTTGPGAIGTVGVAAGKAPPPPGYEYNAQGNIINIQTGQPYVPPQTNTAGPPTPTPTGGTTGTTGNTNTQTNTGAGNTNPYTATAPTYSGLVGALANTSTDNSGVQTAYQNLQNLQNQYATSTSNIQGGDPGLLLSEASGQQGVLNNLYSTKEAAAQTAVQNALAEQEQQITGLNEAGQLAAPQAANALGTYNPTTGTYNQYGGNSGGGISSAANVLGTLSGQTAADQQYVQNNAILGKVNAQLPGLQQAITQSNFNPSSVTGINQLTQWAEGNLSSSSIPEIQGSLNDIVGGLSQVLGVPSSSGSDFRLQFGSAVVNGLQQGQSIEQALQFAINQATAGNLGYVQGANGNTNAQTNSANGGNTTTANSSTFGSFY